MLGGWFPQITPQLEGGEPPLMCPPSWGIYKLLQCPLHPGESISNMNMVSCVW